jgi:hypothetical protein
MLGNTFAVQMLAAGRQSRPSHLEKIGKKFFFSQKAGGKLFKNHKLFYSITSNTRHLHKTTQNKATQLNFSWSSILSFEKDHLLGHRELT